MKILGILFLTLISFSARGSRCPESLDHSFFLSLDENEKLDFAAKRYALFPPLSRAFIVEEISSIRNTDVDELLARWRKTDPQQKIVRLIRQVAQRRKTIAWYRRGDLAFPDGPVEFDARRFEWLSTEEKMAYVSASYRGLSPEARVTVLAYLTRARGEEPRTLLADIQRWERDPAVLRAWRRAS